MAIFNTIRQHLTLQQYRPDKVDLIRHLLAVPDSGMPRYCPGKFWSIVLIAFEIQL